MDEDKALDRTEVAREILATAKVGEAGVGVGLVVIMVVELWLVVGPTYQVIQLRVVCAVSLRLMMLSGVTPAPHGTIPLPAARGCSLIPCDAFMLRVAML